MATYDSEGDLGATQITADPRLVAYTKVMYVLHGVTIVIGIFTSAFIVTAFVFGLPSIIAVIMNYVKRSEARGTWLDSHFRWQLRTFWFSALWMVLAVVAFGWLVFIVVGYFAIVIVYSLIGLWAAYRVIRGWLAISANRAIG